MKIAIIGSREPGNINFAQELERRINIDASDTIISGGAMGIDSLAAQYARQHGLELIEFRPDYAKNGQLTFRNLRNNRKKRNVPGGTLPPTHKKACVI